MPSEQLETIVQLLREHQTDKSLPVRETRAAFEKETQILCVAKDIQCEPVKADNISAEWITAPGAATGQPRRHESGSARKAVRIRFSKTRGKPER